MKRKLLYSSVIVILLLIIAYFAVGNYFYNYALSAQDEKEFMDDNPNLEDSPFIDADAEAESIRLDDAFKASVQSDKWMIESNDKLRLKLQANAYTQSDNHKWAIILHGYTSQSANMTRWIRNFYEQDYNVLAPDLRGHGESEGKYIGMGWHDRLDVLQWIDEIIAKDPEAEIVVFGVSMGGATAMMTSGESLPSNVKVIVEDCGYSSVSGVFIYQLDDLFGLPEFPVLYAANTVAKIRAGYSIYEASAVEQVKKSTTPTLFIHGDADTFVPFEMLQEVYDAAPVEKEMLVIENAAHGDAVKVAPDIYWQTVWGFIGKYVQ
ncbi:alpha/beta hydrolase [Bacillus ndiopicus]|uniref:alpha/beta hydrolase n=1 Tax=Bacillus ndiopicus TaxID=1347368 RepID=UPI0005A98B7E|nr:alpha/beta hydrolase [Bacillus ndiopicus]